MSAAAAVHTCAGQYDLAARWRGADIIVVTARDRPVVVTHVLGYTGAGPYRRRVTASLPEPLVLPTGGMAVLGSPGRLRWADAVTGQSTPPPLPGDEVDVLYYWPNVARSR